VISDPVTKISKGYGFLRFSQQQQATACISDCQGNYILTKAIKLNSAAQRKTGNQLEGPPQNQRGNNNNQMSFPAYN
jgi:hypothetical protein